MLEFMAEGIRQFLTATERLPVSLHTGTASEILWLNSNISYCLNSLDFICIAAFSSFQSLLI